MKRAILLAWWSLILDSVNAGNEAMTVPVEAHNDNDDTSTTTSTTTSYTPNDQASWAVTSLNMTDTFPSQKALYQEFTDLCITDQACSQQEHDRVHVNRHQPSCLYNYTTVGYQKIRTPEPLFTLLQDFWNANKDHAVEEYGGKSAFHNTWHCPTSILKNEDEAFVGGGRNFTAAIWNAARDILEDWTGQTLAGGSVYGIRIYHEGAILTPHVDRLPLVSSAIINVAQDVDEDWPLEVYGHDGQAVNITMQPGDMVLYESHSVLHGRPFPLQGQYYANVFVHFEPMGDADSREPLPEEGSLPPYLIPNSYWQEQYYRENPYGWTLLTNIHDLVFGGDLYTLRYVAQRNVSAISRQDKRCEFLEVATVYRHVDVLQFFLDELEFDVNQVCNGRTALDYAYQRSEEDNAVVALLIDHGGITYDALIDTHPELVTKTDTRCILMEMAVRTRKAEVVQFFVEAMDWDINTVCDDNKYTMMDILMTYYGEDRVPTEAGDEIYAYLMENGGDEKLLLDDPPPDATNSVEDRCTVMETAIEAESIAVLDFLIEDMWFDVDMICGGMAPYDYALAVWDNAQHEIVRHLEDVHDAQAYAEITGAPPPSKEEMYRGRERCDTLWEAIESGNAAILDFLLTRMNYHINMPCNGGLTPLDLAHMARHNNNHDDAMTRHIQTLGGKTRVELLQELHHRPAEDDEDGTNNETGWGDEL